MMRSQHSNTQSGCQITVEETANQISILKRTRNERMQKYFINIFLSVYLYVLFALFEPLRQL